MTQHTVSHKQVGEILKALAKVSDSPQEAAAVLTAAYIFLCEKCRTDLPSRDDMANEIYNAVLGTATCELQ